MRSVRTENRQCKTICIDKRGGKYYWTFKKNGKQVWFLPKLAADLRVSLRDISQFLALFKLEIEFTALKLIQNCCINMTVSLFENWLFHHKLASLLLHMPERLTIWQNIKLRMIQKFQFSNFSVNWEKFEGTTYLS